MTSVLNNWRGYFELTKPGVQALLFVSCASGMLIGSNFNPPVTVFFFGLIGISFLAASSAVVNHFFDKQIDAKMNRTSKRPLVMGHISDRQAIIFSVLLYSSGSIMLLNFTNFLTWLLTTLTFIFYGFIYTKYLKYMTSQNIVIGGASVALPPVIGWTIATNSLTFEPITFFLIIFFWTPSHFWALSLYKADDYQKAKIPMLPITNGIEETKKNIFVYSLIMLPIVILPYYIGFVGETFLVASLLLTFYYNYVCYDLLKFKKNKFEIKKAKKVFSYSIFYLFLLFVLFLVDQIIK